MKRIIPIIMGSEKDYEFAKKIGDKLGEFDLPFEYRVASGHKTPEGLLEIIDEYDGGFDQIVYETVAGRSNALSAVVAARTRNPVIACPPIKDNATFLVDIGSSLRMPSNVPVMTVTDPKNAALSAVKIFSMIDPEIAERFEEYKDNVVKKLQEADQRIRKGKL